jgi:hypothetical protein
MTETVQVQVEGSETIDQKADAVRDALPRHMSVRVDGGKVLVDVPEARDAEEEVTNALNNSERLAILGGRFVRFCCLTALSM